MGNPHPAYVVVRRGIEPQRRVVVEGLTFGCEMKRGNLYAEQGKVGDERWSGARSISGKLLELRR